MTSKLIEPRNNAVHAPLVFVNHADGVELIPMYFFGNPRAVALADRDLKTDISWCRAYTRALADFAETLMFALKFYPQYTWPDRPQLQERDKKSPSRRR
jgi:hypothetical protein